MTIRRLLVLAFLLLPFPAAAASLTVMPTPFQVVSDGAGNPINGGKVCTFVAGTTTPIATYTDVTGATPNPNPIRADGSGRFTAWLIPGTSYKFVYQDASGTNGTCDGVTFYTVDNVSAIPGSAAGVDVTGTAGEALMAGQAVYLSGGDGGKTAGLWYKADSANAYSSTSRAVGVVPSAISVGSTGAIRISGSVTGLSSLAVGSVYYVGTAGALTSTAPINARVIGQADTATSLIVGEPRNAPPTVMQACGRLTLTTALPVTVTDVTAATSVFYTPLSSCNKITLWTGSALITDTLTEQTLAVPATTATLYDVFARDNAGVVNIELLAWTSLTVRATGISVQNGFLAKTGDATRRYIGSFRTTAVSGQTEDSGVKRYVYNYYNRQRRSLARFTTDVTWTYTTATVHQANANVANQVEVVVGFAEAAIDLSLIGAVTNSSNALVSAGIGEDSLTTYAVGTVPYSSNTSGTGAGNTFVVRLVKVPAIGSHVYSWNEWSAATGTSTWIGAQTSVGSAITYGLTGAIEG